MLEQILETVQALQRASLSGPSFGDAMAPFLEYSQRAQPFGSVGIQLSPKAQAEQVLSDLATKRRVMRDKAAQVLSDLADKRLLSRQQAEQFLASILDSSSPEQVLPYSTDNTLKLAEALKGASEGLKAGAAPNQQSSTAEVPPRKPPPA